MDNKLERLSVILSTILCFFAIIFVIYGLVKVYQGENAITYFLLAGCFGIISAGKKIWDKKGDNKLEQ
ncbi:MAG: hypothetical protein IJZ23_01785 [Roseburia sp.]|nr:hypothetical protein [Roseburia sp.]